MRHDAHGHWLAQAPRPEPRAPLSGDRDADVVVVGGGYTGLWSAWWIKRLEPQAAVVLLEAGVCGEGPSGRNGGFVNSMWFSLPTLRERFGDDAALEVCRAAADSIREVGRFCEAEGVDAAYRHAGYLQAATAESQLGSWDEIVRSCRELGEGDAVEVLDESATRARCGSPLFRGGAFYPDAATVDPALLVRGLRDRVIDAGVEVFEHSPVTATELGDAALVRTHAGSVRAGRAVLAAGGRLLRQPGLRLALTNTSSHMVVTEPVPDLIEELGWTGGECVTDSRAMIHYFRTTRDGRIAFGWGGGRIVLGSRLGGRVEVDPGLAGEVSEHLLRFFPQLEGRRIEHAWGGPIDVSPSHLPVIRSLGGDRAFAGFGYTGNGVGPSQMVGRSLASLALGRRDDPARLPLIDPPRSTVPPEPLRWAGGALIRRALLRKETLEERDRPVGPLTRFVAGIPERIGIHVGR